MFSRTVPVEQEDVLAHVAHRPAERREAQLVGGDAVDRDAPGHRVVQAEQELHDRRLARAGRPDDGVGLAGGHPQVEVGDAPGGRRRRRRTRARRRTSPRTGSGRVRPPVDDGRRHRQQVEDASGRGHGPLVEVERLAEPGERPEQALGHVDEHREQADLEVAPQHRVAAPQQGDGEAGQDRHADHRHERRRQPDGVAVGLAVGLAGRLDPRRLAAPRPRNARMVAMPERLLASIAPRSPARARTPS